MEKIFILEDEYPFWEEKVNKLKSEYQEAWKAIWEAAWPNCDWHDNFAFDDAQRTFSIIGDKITRVNEILQNANIIKNTNQNSEKISIWKKVSVIINDIEEKEFDIGGYETPINGRVSYNAPIIKPLLGKEIGDFVEIIINWSKKEIEILDIK